MYNLTLLDETILVFLCVCKLRTFNKKILISNEKNKIPMSFLFPSASTFQKHRWLCDQLFTWTYFQHLKLCNKAYLLICHLKKKALQWNFWNSDQTCHFTSSKGLFFSSLQQLKIMRSIILLTVNLLQTVHKYLYLIPKILRGEKRCFLRN